MLTANSIPEAHGKSHWILVSLVLATFLLAVGQLAVGTSVSFAVAVAVTLLVALLTLRIVGLSSIPGMLIALLMIRYLVVSQLAKTLLGQPGDSNLAAPETTIAVILVGTMSICAGAIVVASFLRGRRLLQFSPSMPQLVGFRNVTFLIGSVCTAIAYQEGTRDFSQLSYGGLGAIATEFSGFIYLALMTDTWLALTRSNGRRSTSPSVVALCLALTVYGFLANSKQGIASPLVAYLIASYSFRRRISKQQIAMTIVALIFGVVVLYPANQLMRGRLNVDPSATEAAGQMFTQLLQDPSSLALEWEILTTIPIEELSLNEQQLFYLGTADDLAGRFLLIANTDVIVNAVNENGPYGPDLITQGFLMAMPTFLLPDKPRIQQATS